MIFFLSMKNIDKNLLIILVMQNQSLYCLLYIYIKTFSNFSKNTAIHPNHQLASYSQNSTEFGLQEPATFLYIPKGFGMLGITSFFELRHGMQMVVYSLVAPKGKE